MKITVFLGSSSGARPEFEQEAEEHIEQQVNIPLQIFGGQNVYPMQILILTKNLC